LVLRGYKGLYYVIVFDKDESELALIDLLAMIIDSLEGMMAVSEVEI